jgi:Arc/MetJ family transcription regulator
MKTTIDIPDKELRDVIKNTRAKTKREAVVKAIAEYNRRQRVEELNRMMGTLGGFITLEELQKLREMD